MRFLLSLVLGALISTACAGAAAVQPRAAASSAPAAAASTASPVAAPAAASPSGASPAATSSPAAALRSPQSPAPAPMASAAPSGTVVTSWNSPKYGQILVDSRGHVLYLFTPDDATGAPTCTGSCAAAWPPFTPSGGAPRAEGAAQQSKLGESGGQVTYGGHPLYFYAGDPGPDQANGQCSGHIWYVLAMDGSAITAC